MPDIVALDPDVLAARADWAHKFPGTNAAQRAQHSGDEAAYAQALQQQQAEHMANLIATDKNAAAIYKGQQQLDMAREKHAAEMEHFTKMAPLQEQVEAQRLKAQHAQELAQARKELREGQISEQSALAHTELDNHLYDTSIPGEVRNARVNALPEKYPMAIHDPAFKERLTQAQKDLSPETPMTEAQRNEVEQRAAGLYKENRVAQDSWTKFEADLRANNRSLRPSDFSKTWDADAFGNKSTVATWTDEEGNPKSTPIKLPAALHEQFANRYKALLTPQSTAKPPPNIPQPQPGAPVVAPASPVAPGPNTAKVNPEDYFK